MNNFIDFSNIEQNERMYGGISCHKLGITYKDKNYLLKFPAREDIKNAFLSYSTTPLSEYLSSHIYEMLSIPVHKTFLAFYKNKLVCACEDFRLNTDILTEFHSYKVTFIPRFTDSLGNETSGSGTDLEEVLKTINEHPKLKDVKGVKMRFWDMFIIDALVGNTDRNNGNWGVILHSNNQKELAPVYDNGNSFFQHWDEEKINNYLKDKILFENMAYGGRVCVFTINGKKINPYHIIQRCQYKGCNDALIRLLPNIKNNFDKITSFIDNIPNKFNDIDIISQNQKLLYNTLMKERITKIFEPTYNNLVKLSISTSKTIKNKKVYYGYER